jgi:hypothetical protein
VKIVKNEQDTIIYRKKFSTFERKRCQSLKISSGPRKIQNGECMKESTSFALTEEEKRSLSEPKIIPIKKVLHKSLCETMRDNEKNKYRNFERNQTISVSPSISYQNRAVENTTWRAIKSDTKNRRSLYARSKWKVKKPTFEGGSIPERSQDVQPEDETPVNIWVKSPSASRPAIKTVSFIVNVNKLN